MGQVTSVLGTITPALSAVTRAVTAVEQVSSAFGGGSSYDRRDEDILRQEQQQALRQLEQRQNEKLRQERETAALEREKISDAARASEEKRQAALRRAVARQNVQFASQGITGGDGSSEAVLLGLFEESESDKQERDRLDNIRNRALDQSLTATNRLNILQRNQLLEQQRLDRVASGF